YGRRRTATGSPFAESVRARAARRRRHIPVARAKSRSASAVTSGHTVARYGYCHPGATSSTLNLSSRNVHGDLFTCAISLHGPSMMSKGRRMSGLPRSLVVLAVVGLTMALPAVYVKPSSIARAAGGTTHVLSGQTPAVVAQHKAIVRAHHNAAATLTLNI